MTLPNSDELLRVIWRYCLICSGGCMKNVNGCSVHECNLYPYRSKDAMGIEKRTVKLKGQIEIADLIGLK